MKKVIVVTFFILLIGLFAWTLFVVFRREETTLPPQPTGQPAAKQPQQVAEPSPDSLEALTTDTLNEALTDIDLLE